MNALLPIQKTITFLILSFTLSIIPKQVMAVPGISHYPTQVNTDVDISCLNLLLYKSNISIVSKIAYTPESGEKKGQKGEPKNAEEGGGAR
ncbi:MAG: hypothetical protein F6K40_04580 [Okeania sp. SIO3I5]|uniref:hypothetical protein n=1 Tax=Okeania sp. SIO3I5 TaxID=2607805 RepID=UPI0013BD33B0|nr:hypothetical protein [Okeania sp. SIO3I5]NEQ35611.1 hypothetical protein [Okeania sp. SIO3I5]